MPVSNAMNLIGKIRTTLRVRNMSRSDPMQSLNQYQLDI